MKIESILDIARKLIKAIDENTTSGQIEENNFCAVIPKQYIADELEELREWVKNGTLEKRETD